MQRNVRHRQSIRAPLYCGAIAAIVGTGFGARAIITNLVLVSALHPPQATHVEQADLVALVRNNQTEQAFEAAFEQGDTLFATAFNAVDGVGANVGQGQRFTRVPRADLAGPGEWATHTPARATGPNAQACNACHNQAGEDGGGSAAANVHRDPEHSADLKHFIQRNGVRGRWRGSRPTNQEEIDGREDGSALTPTPDAVIARVTVRWCTRRGTY
jgi:hypothetical protein